MTTLGKLWASGTAVVVLVCVIYWLCRRAANKKPEVIKRSKWGG